LIDGNKLKRYSNLKTKGDKNGEDLSLNTYNYKNSYPNSPMVKRKGMTMRTPDNEKEYNSWAEDYFDY
jgi:hypothetical protein